MGAVVGALAAVSLGFAPHAAAYDDVQSKQWYLEPMQAEQMWKVSTGKGVKVAVIDTGVDANTSSLKGQVLTDEVPKSVAYRATVDYTGHGTTMAELIAGTGAGGGLKGLAPGAKIVPYRIELEGLTGGAEEKQKTPDAVDAIRAAADTDVKIINMSFGGDGPSPKDKAAIEYAASKGKLLIAAVGNDGRTNGRIGYPASFPYVVGVSAADESGTVSKFSSHGGYVDLTAPGQDFPGWCDANFRSYCDDVNGTSSATAIASASAALIWSAHPDWTVNQVTRSLVDTAGRSWPKNDPSTYLGYGAVRPRVVLANPDYNPGPANVDPLARENGGDLLAKSADSSSSSASSSPSASASAASQAPEKGSGGATSAAGSSADSSSDSNTLWIAMGAATAVIVIGGGGFAVMRARRAR
ncbi:type VII secretion-associated serine protease [Streptomyces olivochromogenes]|uniref:Type VII secretion-associated serine protease n=1 Tax=Streptomyces olivochromogenes TaxID=1963 RepID=A0A250VBJ9_STROL|nr:type VII secretion-associated serine protease [Streptomyces olivochromogenes]